MSTPTTPVSETKELLSLAWASARLVCSCIGQVIYHSTAQSRLRVSRVVTTILLSRPIAWTLAGGGWGLAIGIIALTWR